MDALDSFLKITIPYIPKCKHVPSNCNHHQSYSWATGVTGEIAIGELGEKGTIGGPGGSGENGKGSGRCKLSLTYVCFGGVFGGNCDTAFRGRWNPDIFCVAPVAVVWGGILLTIALLLPLGAASDVTGEGPTVESSSVESVSASETAVFAPGVASILVCGLRANKSAGEPGVLGVSGRTLL